MAELQNEPGSATDVQNKSESEIQTEERQCVTRETFISGEYVAKHPVKEMVSRGTAVQSGEHFAQVELALQFEKVNNTSAPQATSAKD